MTWSLIALFDSVKAGCVLSQTQRACVGAARAVERSRIRQILIAKWPALIRRGGSQHHFVQAVGCAVSRSAGDAFATSLNTSNLCGDFDAANAPAARPPPFHMRIKQQVARQICNQASTQDDENYELGFSAITNERSRHDECSHEAMKSSGSGLAPVWRTAKRALNSHESRDM
jgi:hypothetical protein